MAYATTNPPVQLAGGMMGGGAIGRGGNIWYYSSTDAVATVVGAAYFSNGVDLGMELGDIVYVVETDNASPYLLTICSVSVASSTAHTVVASTA
jgi:hypothetical protein